MLFHIKQYMESVLFLEMKQYMASVLPMEIVDAARSEFSCARCGTLLYFAY